MHARSGLGVPAVFDSWIFSHVEPIRALGAVEGTVSKPFQPHSGFCFCDYGVRVTSVHL